MEELSSAEDSILAALGDRKNPDQLRRAHEQVRSLASRVKSFGDFYILKYHQAFLERELAKARQGPPPPTHFDDIETSGFDYFYGRGDAAAADMIRKVKQSRQDPVEYTKAKDPGLEVEAARQLATGHLCEERMHHRCDRLLAAMDLKGLSVVDYACGTGITLSPLLEAVGPTGKVYAVDLAQSVLDFIRERGEKDPRLKEWKRVRLVLATPTDSGLSTGSVDVIFLDSFPLQPRNSEVYATQVKPLVANLLRVLEPGGRLVVWSYKLPLEEVTAIMREAGFQEAKPLAMGNFYESGLVAPVFVKP